ncbi:MAG: agmatine deiminase family protein [Cohaesibacteraceae bacterium]|nr:agmatine deiminase family protein [Cohaesibacteraceae bacterium]
MVSRRIFLSTLAGLAGTLAMMNGDARAVSGSNGFVVPEESDPHLRTFMQWPVSRVVHPDAEFLDILQQTIADIANAIVDFEPVVMLMDARFEPAARRLLDGRIDVWHIPTDDLWCRDSGPLFVRDASGQQAIRHLNFNGWGNKQVHHNDGLIARRIAQRLDLEILDNGLVGEAGGVELDGAGTLLAHESCWVNTNRNLQNRGGVEALLLEAFGADRMIWTPGLKGEDITDYHIDSLARFVGPGHVLFQMPDPGAIDDSFADAALETLSLLEQELDGEGNPLKFSILEEPLHRRVKSEDFVASYVNYYVCNGAVIMPQFGDTEEDVAARETMQELYPDRQIVQLNTDAVGEVGGGIHCATMQQPV